MWYGIMEEFNCKATSTWSKCGRAKETAFHAQTTRRQEARIEIAAGLHRWAEKER